MTALGSTSLPGIGGFVPGGDSDREGIAAELEALKRSLAIVTLASDGTVLDANESFLKLLGYQTEDIVGRSHRIMLPADEAAVAQENLLWSALQRGEGQTGDFRRLRKDRSETWIRGSYVPIPDASGHPARIVAHMLDIGTEKRRAVEDRGQIAAIENSQAVIHFALDGTILDANPIFLDLMGYRHDEVIGRHHRMFLEQDYAESEGYAAFWSRIAAGDPHRGEYKRLGKEGRKVWLKASYNPVHDLDGRPLKIVKYATDVTTERLRQADHEAQIMAIRRSQAVIEFNTDGTIIDANAIFLDAVGYSLEEIEGRHHRTFVDPSYAHSSDYATFWSDLSKGRHRAGEYRRIGKDGQDLWLQATYSPVFDLDAKPFKIVKHATVVTQEKLRQADHQGQIAAIHKAQCVISFDLDGIILDANDNFLAATGYRLAHVRGRHHRMFVEPAYAQSAEYAAFWASLGKGYHQAGEFRRLGNGGREIWLQATYNPIFDMNGRPFKIVKYATDVTQQKKRQADHEGQIAAIQKSQCVVVFDMDGIICDANENFLNAVGYELAEIIGRHHRIFVAPEVADSVAYGEFWNTLRSGAFHSARYKRIGKGGREVWIQATYNPILDLNGTPYKVIKFATDVTADVALAEALTRATRQAEHDAVTSLPNRVRLASFMRVALAEAGARLAILYLDLDRFKPINDTFGHDAGDDVLREVANRLRGAVPEDQIIARVGGDEFVVAAPNLARDGADALCRRLIETVTAPIRLDGRDVKVGLSIGVAMGPDDGETADELMRSADAALYVSKSGGRGRHSFFAPAINERISAERSLGEDMRRGLARGEFFLEYQLRLNTRTRRVQSVEALVRWQHPERGRLAPADFIPLAETNGLIVPLGAWVLRTACRAALAWPTIGISVNVSPVQFRGGDFVKVVDAVLIESGLAAARLELEITEGVLIEDAGRARALLSALKARGVRLAIDDFGTGISSLSVLRNFPFDVIKIDQRVIADMETEDDGRSIVQAILGLGKALGVPVAAEGVETRGQLLMLTIDQCSEMQGFLLGHPMSADDITRLLAEEDEHLLLAAG